MDNKRAEDEKVRQEIRIINSSPPTSKPNGIIITEAIGEKRRQSKQGVSDEEKDSLPTSPNFLNAIKITKDAYFQRKDSIDENSQTRHLSFDTNGITPAVGSYNARKRENEFDEEKMQDIVYNPCELVITFNLK